MIERAPRESSTYDIIYLLERLEELLSSGTGLPFTRRRLVDDEQCLAIIEQIRLNLPHEVRQARRINTERETLVEEAQARAAQIVRAAEADAEERLQEHHLTRRAESRGHEVITQAERRAAQMQRDVDEYAYSVLSDLERQLEGQLTSLRAGLTDLEDRIAPADESVPDPLSDQG